jgi:hypothetical protein
VHHDLEVHVKSLRFWVITTLGWFFLLYNIERISEPINIASFVYVLTVVFAILIIVLPWLQRIPVLALVALPLPLFFALKIWFGYQIGNKNLPVTITEICFIGLTAILARRIGLGLEEFNEAGINLLLVDNIKRRAQPFETGQAEIYREIHRARRYQRPLSLLAVSATDPSVKFSLDRLRQEVQDNLIKNYVAAGLADMLLEEMYDSDIITQREDHFIILLPEITRKNVSEVVRKLELAAKERLGLELTFGVSTFPDEEITFERLLDRAEADMRLSSDRVDDDQEQMVSATEDPVLAKGEVSISR